MSKDVATFEPKTVSGRMLAAFLRGLLPETQQFDRQIAQIEWEAMPQPPGAILIDPTAPETVAALAAALHVEFWEDAFPHEPTRDGCLDMEEPSARRILPAFIARLRGEP